MPVPTEVTVHPMPWETTPDTGKTIEESLFDALGPDDGGTGKVDGEVPADQPEDELEDDEELDPADDPDDDEVEDDDGEPDSARLAEKHEVTLPGGEKAAVTLEELKAGYSRNSDYTQKTQQVAAERKAVQAELETVRGARTQYETMLDSLGEALEQMKPAEPNWDELRVSDPAEYAAQRADFDQYERDRNAIAVEKTRLAAEKQAEAATAWASRLVQERALMNAAIPEWKDEKVATAERREIAAFAKAQGYTDEELASVADHRVMVLLRKAYLHDKAAAGAADVRKNRRRDAQVLRPGNREVPVSATDKPGVRTARTRAMTTLKQTGSVRDAAAAIATMLP